MYYHAGMRKTSFVQPLSCRFSLFYLLALGLFGVSAFTQNVPPTQTDSANAVQTEDAFPFKIVIESVLDLDVTHMSRKEEIESAENGIEPPHWVYFYGTLNGENHWVFDCRKENTLHESIPCTTIPTGEYRGRWIHNNSIMQIVGGPPEKQISRFLNVSANPKNPLIGDDPVLHYGIYNFPVQFPSGKGLKDYPILAHIYDGNSLAIPTRTLPARTRCNIHTWSVYQTTVNCNERPPIEIHSGYVTLDFSAGEISFASLHCDVGWRWSHCSVLDPGLYYTRIDKDRVMLLTHDEDGKPREVGFSMQTPNNRIQSPIK